MSTRQQSIGNRIAPPRFLAFCVIAAVAVPIAIARSGWSTGIMVGFDIAATVFLLSIVPLLTRSDADAMRDAAERNDANRVVLLGITGATSIAILAAVVGELAAKGAPPPLTIALVIGTLALSWLFANTVYALHYAHLYYSKGDDSGDAAGLDFPECDEPDYWDFIYFAFTLGMTFQTSDVSITDRGVRRTVTFHCLAAFVFNLGVIAFTINVIGGS
ncbi:DUF1345 domain-containing protein [Sphingomonas donggukensis]|uniref:DUF1345 domain-containing protein n=1 Tax=Sphingomonas donggukensis TaxID=2949093 RepID=A0ABY4TVN6_9SPHN|nr:DUF1345 domain-containing protein [Sphingomonas donggukensis]URW74616.1 DUF1345 domain-containing protein [Sphingomonas donggukensis]